MPIVNQPPFKEGQLWAYAARPNEAGSTIKIHKIESDPEHGTIFHIGVRGLKLKNRQVPSGVTTDLGHIVVTAESLRSSVTALIGTEPLSPKFLESYATFSAAHKEGHARVHDTTVADIVVFFEQLFN
jgi:hypothetical protein